MALVLGLLFLASCKEDEPVVAKPTAWAEIDGEAVSAKDIRLEAQLNFGDWNDETSGEPSADMLRQTVREHVERNLLCREAEARNLILLDQEVDAELDGLLEALPEERKIALMEDKDKLAVVRRMTKENTLAMLLFAKDLFLRITVSDDELKADYEKTPEDFTVPTLYKVQQIVCATAEDAEEALKRLKKGDAFVTVAAEMSIAPEKERGGHLGWIRADQMPDPFPEWLVTLKVGKVSKPLESPHGFHLLLLIEKSKEGVLSFEEAKPKVRNRIMERKKRQVRQETVDRLWKQHRVRIYEENIH